MAGSVPLLSRSSISCRFSRATDPWCARTTSLPANSFRAAASRSARRRELTKIIVERCARISSRRRGWTCGQMLRFSGSGCVPGSPPGISTRTSNCLRDPASTMVTGRGRHLRPEMSPPPRSRATSSRGRCVADSPMRCSFWPEACSLSRERNRCAPLFVATSEWISSMMTVSTERRISRACEVSSRYSDSGVVMRMSGGARCICARSAGGVSPVRMPTAGRWSAPPRAAMPARGALRFRSTSAARALSGETYRTRHLARLSGGGVNINRSMAVRKAASVLPEPVGASSSVEWPSRMGGQPSAWARVGAAKEASNQARRGSWKGDGSFCNESAPRASKEGRDGTLRHNDAPGNEQRLVALCIKGMREPMGCWAVRSKGRKGRSRGNERA